MQCSNGHETLTRQRFCGTCGTPLGETDGVMPAAPQPSISMAGTPEHPSYAMPSVRRSWPLKLVGCTVAIIIVAVIAAVAATRLGGATKLTLRGDIAITDEQMVLMGHSSGTPSLDVRDDGSCTATDGYDDIADGAQVTVRDPGNRVIGTGYLTGGHGRDTTSPGIFDGITNESQTCSWQFTVPRLPKEKFYQVSVTHRGNVTFTYAQVRADDVHLTLGSSQ